MNEIETLCTLLRHANASDEGYENFLSMVLDYANRNRKEFKEYVRSISLESDNCLFEIYHALAADDRWSDFILEEINRILQTAETSPAPSRVLEPLEAMAFYCRSKHAQPIGTRLMKEVVSRSLPVRRRVVWVVGSFIDVLGTESVETMKGILAHDPDWRIRNYARYCLEDMHALPEGYKESVLNKLRRRFLKEFDY